MKAQITLTNGVQLEVDVTEITKGRDHLTGVLQSLSWTSSADPGSRELFYIRLSEVAAIVTVDDTQPPEEPAP
jgi:hypothetical protein